MLRTTGGEWAGFHFVCERFEKQSKRGHFVNLLLRAAGTHLPPKTYGVQQVRALSRCLVPLYHAEPFAAKGSTLLLDENLILGRLKGNMKLSSAFFPGDNISLARAGCHKP